MVPLVIPEGRDAPEAGVPAARCNSVRSSRRRPSWLRPERGSGGGRELPLEVARKLSATALSYAPPTEPIEGFNPTSRHRLPNFTDVY
jgi:hypothetical protein